MNLSSLSSFSFSSSSLFSHFLPPPPSPPRALHGKKQLPWPTSTTLLHCYGRLHSSSDLVLFLLLVILLLHLLFICHQYTTSLHGSGRLHCSVISSFSLFSSSSSFFSYSLFTGRKQLPRPTSTTLLHCLFLLLIHLLHFLFFCILSFSALFIGKQETISLAMSIQLWCIAAEDCIAVKISSSSSSTFTEKKTVALVDKYNCAALLRKVAL